MTSHKATRLDMSQPRITKPPGVAGRRIDRRDAYPQNQRPAGLRRGDTKMQTVHSPSGEAVHVPAWVAAMVNEAQVQLAAPADAQRAAPTEPRMVTVKFGDQTAEVPEWLADQLRTIASSPGGRAIIEQALTGREIEKDALEASARFVARQGYDGNSRTASNPLLDPALRGLVYGPGDSLRTDSTDEVDETVARFMERQGY